MLLLMEHEDDEQVLRDMETISEELIEWLSKRLEGTPYATELNVTLLLAQSCSALSSLLENEEKQIVRDLLLDTFKQDDEEAEPPATLKPN